MVYAKGIIFKITMSTRTGNMQTFLDSLRAFESGTNPAKTEWYIKNYVEGATVTYAKLTEDGRLAEGRVIPEAGTIQDYFSKIKTADIFEKAMEELGIFSRDGNGNITVNEEAITEQNLGLAQEVVEGMQYSVVNPWGFVGYQLGEAAMIDAGYYTPADAFDTNGNPILNGAGEPLKSYYMWTSGVGFDRDADGQPIPTPMKWNDSYTELVKTSPENATLVVTPQNRWEGTFTGKNGVNSFEDLLDPAKQNLAVRDLMAFNITVVNNQLTASGKTLDDVIGNEYPYSFKSSYTAEELENLREGDPDAKITVTGENNNGILKTYSVQVETLAEITMSGILASSHLLGAWGTAAALQSGQFGVDETGTSGLKYMYDFGGHRTIFGSEVENELECSGSGVISRSCFLCRWPSWLCWLVGWLLAGPSS